MTEEILVSEKSIAQKVHELAEQIAKAYKTKPFVLVSILKGANVFTADLQRALYKEGCVRFQLSFIVLRSYGTGTESSGTPQLVLDIDFDPTGKNILLIDDVYDTGLSLHYVSKLFKERGASTVKSCVLVSKNSKRNVSYSPDYIGFTLPDVWLEGYGMDTNESGRGNPNIITRESLSL